ncbi:hypothetical protein CCACVL1_14334 [Corchorus capsularis]|uniref:Uncharacterized protein n=1 Tax=Corchorus capsularis TaxID=210143 RepID=A0A1R3I7D3_COCAP|nr:hypothetical protein CCACVL1_14334 [Corchorus capsularis]
MALDRQLSVCVKRLSVKLVKTPIGFKTHIATIKK